MDKSFTNKSENNGSESNSGKMTASLKETMAYLNERLAVDTCFDIVYRVIKVGGRDACMYFIDGFCKDELMQKMLQYFMDLTEDEMPRMHMK